MSSDQGDMRSPGLCGVLRNPGWLLPYLSCVLVTLGLLLHFALNLRRSQATRPAAVALEA